MTKSKEKVAKETPKQTYLWMHPSLKMVAEFMSRNLPYAELRGVAEALAIVAPAIWAQCPQREIIPMELVDDEENN